MGTGIFFASIFYIGTKEPKKRARRSTVIYIDFMVRNDRVNIFNLANPNGFRCFL